MDSLICWRTSFSKFFIEENFLRQRAPHGAQAAEAGDTSAMYFMGVLCAAQGDADGASRAWRRVIEEDQEDELVVGAALALAAISALKADFQFARDLLEIAGARGWTFAGTCTAAFDANPLVRADARRRLQDLAGDTDALNFLGAASYIDCEYHEARSYWTCSSDLDDAVAPLLLHLVAKPQPPARTKPAEGGKPSSPPGRT